MRIPVYLGPMGSALLGGVIIGILLMTVLDLGKGNLNLGCTADCVLDKKAELVNAFVRAELVGRTGTNNICMKAGEAIDRNLLGNVSSDFVFRCAGSMCDDQRISVTDNAVVARNDVAFRAEIECNKQGSSCTIAINEESELRVIYTKEDF